jgi:hypothetical protein
LQRAAIKASRLRRNKLSRWKTRPLGSCTSCANGVGSKAQAACSGVARARPIPGELPATLAVSLDHR